MIEERALGIMQQYGTEETRQRMRAVYDVSLYMTLSTARKNLDVEEAAIRLAHNWLGTSKMGPAWGRDPTWAFQPDHVLASAKRLEERGLVNVREGLIIIPMRRPDGLGPFLLKMKPGRLDYELFRPRAS